MQPQGTGGGVRIPTLTPDRIAQFSALFERSGAQNGRLPGDVARLVFEKADLPNQILGAIWGLADREGSGGLDMTEFIVAMHLITSYRSKAMTALPTVLPAALYDAASRRPLPGRHGGGISPVQTAAAMPRQFSGAGSQRASSPLVRPPYGTPPPPAQVAQTTGQDAWLVTPQEKAKYDIFFNQLDTARIGFISGEQAVAFFGNSRLPEDTLASIWDLADIKSEGRLDRDLFAVAMYLVRQQRSGGPPLPAFLPPTLIPPSMRHQTQSTESTAPVFDNANNAPTMPKSATDELFGLDLSPAPIATSDSQNVSSPFEADPFAGSSLPSSPATPQQAQHQGVSSFRPFQPSSAFGASITGQNTGSGNNTQAPFRGPQHPPKPPSPRQSLQQSSSIGDLLGGDDDEQSKNISQETTELANISSQVGNLRNQMQEVHTRKDTHERELQTAGNQKKELQQRLAQFRQQYEQEVAVVKSIEQQLSQTRESTRTMQQELAMIEGTHEDLLNKHQQIASQLATDQRENATLKERIGTLTAEITRLRPAIEKLKSEARQTKGIVAINKKQLATNETERDNLRSSHDSLTQAAEQQRSQSVPLAEIETASRGASPTPSNGMNNPFFRQSSQQRTSSMPSTVSSPPNAAAFDALFGPSLAGNGPAGPSTPPVPIFQHQTISGTSASSDGRLTPSATPPLSTVHDSPPSDATAAPPPPPPETRQFTPNMLPMRPPPSRDHSIASSTRAMPPGSRADFNEPTPSLGDTPQFQRSGGLLGAIPVRSSNLASNSETIPGAFPRDAISPVKQGASLPSGQISSSGSPEQKSDRPLAGAQHADDSSSDDDDGPEDKFTNRGGTSRENSLPIDQLGTSRDTNAGAAVQPPASELPPITAQAPPPAYTSAATISSNDEQYKQPEEPSRSESAHMPSEFEGLLPSRSPPRLTASPPPINGPEQTLDPGIIAGSGKLRSDLPHRSVSGMDKTHALDNTGSRPPSDSDRRPSGNAAGKAPQAGKSAFDDAFADFDDLDEAKEVNDKSFDFADSHSEAEFNPTFDSPAASMSMSGVGPILSQQQNPSSKPEQPGANDMTGFHFFSPTSQPAASAKPGPQSAGSHHDWDAIFSGLDNPAPVAGPIAGTRSEFEQIPTPRASPPTIHAPTASHAGPSAGPGHASKESIDRANDDPFLSKLMSMGYPRDKALTALEKYDYDINKVC